jgi:hypothetical protein
MITMAIPSSQVTGLPVGRISIPLTAALDRIGKTLPITAAVGSNPNSRECGVNSTNTSKPRTMARAESRLRR